MVDEGREMPIIAIISAGAMGAGLARRLTSSNEGHASCTVLTILDGRSQATRDRARNAGMKNVPSLNELFVTSPAFLDAVRADVVAIQRQRNGDHKDTESTRTYPTFVDCNAKNPSTARRFAQFVRDARVPVTFIDGSIVGLPPRDDHDPSVYASTSPDPAHQRTLSRFQDLNEFGLKVKAMTGGDVDVGDASALKMTFSGIMKGMVGLYKSMILAAHAHSPATAKALIEELRDSQPMHLRNIGFYVPNAFSKAYRFVYEMTEMENFLHVALDDGDGDGISKMFDGFGHLYERVAASEAGDHKDIEVLAYYANYANSLSRSL